MIIYNESSRYKPLAAAFLVLFPFAQVLVYSPTTVQSFPPLNAKKKKLNNKLSVLKTMIIICTNTTLLTLLNIEFNIVLAISPTWEKRQRS